MVERFNLTLESMLTMYAKKRQNRWDEHLPYIMLAYRASVHGSTGYNPNMMMLGGEVELSLQSVVTRPIENEVENVEGYVQGMYDKMEMAHEDARAHLK